MAQNVGPQSSRGITKDQLFRGIATQESGGNNYKAVNRGSGALGKYQIMPYNVPAWSKKYFGVVWSPSQFLNDPRKQDALAKAVLGDYFDKWGARGAASAWYSGNPSLQNNYRPQRGGPSIGSYVDQVLAHALKGGGGTTGGDTFVPWGNQDPDWQPKPYEGLITVKDKRAKADTPADVFASAYPGSGAVGAPGAAAGEEMDTSSAGMSGQLEMVQAVTTQSPFEQRTGQFSPPKQPDLTATSAEDAGAAGPAGSGNFSGGYKNQMAILNKQFPGLRMTSGFRPGAITATGNVSYHAKGRAVDLPGSQAVFDWIRKNYGATTKELIWTPAGGRQIKNGKPLRYTGVTANNHEDHIHWAF